MAPHFPRVPRILRSQASSWAPPARIVSRLCVCSQLRRARLYDRVVEVLRARHYSRRTEQAYVHWIRRFILFHAPTHLRQLTEGDVNRFPDPSAGGRLRHPDGTRSCWGTRT